jgi:polyhydroxyalkanoate synthesis regulator phasin
LRDAFNNADGRLDQYGDLVDGNGQLSSSELNRYVDTLANQLRQARAAVAANSPNLDQSDVDALEETYIAARALKENFAAVAALDSDDTVDGDDRYISSADIAEAVNLDGQNTTLSFRDAAILLGDVDTSESALETPVTLDAAIDAVKEADVPGKFGTRNGKVTSAELQQSLLQKAQMLKSQNNLLDDMNEDNADFDELTESVNKLTQDTALLNALITNFAVIAGEDGNLTTTELTTLAGRVTTGTGEGAGILSQADIDKAVTDAAA